MKLSDKYLIIILFAALFLRVGYILTLEESLLFPDEIRYHEIALNFVQGREYDSAFTAPLYPLFLTVVYTISGDSHLTARMVQAVIGTISIFIIYFLGKEVFSIEIGLIAASLGAIYPLFIFFTGLLLTETLFILLFLCLIYLLQKMMKERKRACAVLLGILSGLCLLIKPLLAYFLPFVFLAILFVSRDRNGVAGDWLLIFIMAGVVLSPWIGRNYLRYRAFIPLTTGGGLALYDANGPHATGAPASGNIVYTPEMKRMTEVELDRYFKREAIKFIVGHPKKFLKLAIIKFIRFWSLALNAKEYSNFFYNAISVLSYGPVLLLAILGIITSRRIWYEVMVLYLPIIFFWVISLILVGSIRYRLPIDPYLILFASYGIVTLGKRVKGINRQKFL